MSVASLRSRLLAILVADVAGYSRLMELDEKRTIASLDAARAVFSEEVARHGGRVIDMAGDSVLAAFETATGAAKAALAVQERMPSLAGESADALDIQFRIGIHVGDVIEKADGTVYGDGVNIAARLEALAAPGALAVSQAVHGIVARHVDAVFEDIGDQTLKNIARPVHTFRARPRRADEPREREARDPAVATSRGSAMREPALFGRDQDLATISRLLASQPLVTITGAGGIGKTRLASAAASDFRAQQALHQVAWVDLAAISDPRLIQVTVAAAASLSLDQGQDAISALASLSEQRRLLVVLDNCEHLIDHIATLAATLVDGARGIRILATSRAPLNVAREEVYRLGALDVPAPEASKDAEQYGAIALFTSRVRAADRHFKPDAKAMEQVIEICRRLDGIPLALELAAARVPALGLSNLALMLDQRLHMLTAGSRTAEARHKTMVATFDWSHELLGDDERAVFRRLAVFTGGFTLEAALQVASSSTLDEVCVVEALAGLVEKSLVFSDGTDPPRYSLLETGRAYALRKLEEAAETVLIEREHALYFRDFIVAAYDTWVAGPELDWLAHSGPELANLRTALQWAFDQDDGASAVALVGSVMPVWLDLPVRDLAEGQEYVRRAKERLDANTESARAARLWLAAGMLGTGQEQSADVAAYQRSVALYREGSSKPALCLSLIILSRTLTRVGELDDAFQALHEARSLLDGVASPKLRGLYEHALGRHRLSSGDGNSAVAAFESAIACFEEAACEALTLYTMLDLANTRWMLGELECAKSAFQVLLTRIDDYSPVNKDVYRATALANLTGVLVELGTLTEAVAIARQALPLLAATSRGLIILDALALRLGLSEQMDNAARILGFSDAAYQKSSTTRDASRQRMRATLLHRLQQQVNADVLVQLTTEGAQLSAPMAYRVAV